MSQQKYYLPEPSHWPLVGSIGLFVALWGFASALPEHTSFSDPATAGGIGDLTMMYIGFAIIAVMMFGWFGTVIKESEAQKYNAQVDTSFRMGMLWFIYSEVMFFAAFFGALFYARTFSVPWLAGGDELTHTHLFPNFEGGWPLMTAPIDTAVEAAAAKYTVVKSTISAWGLPLINTILLLSSSVTVTFAHHALRKGHRTPVIVWLFITVALGFAFFGVQAYEYIHAYDEAINLKLTSGIYGTTFFVLTGFHGAHVTVGATILTIILIRCIKGHFTADNHFGFEAAAWYWHFVDVVWVGLFIFVYWL